MMKKTTVLEMGLAMLALLLLSACQPLVGKAFEYPSSGLVAYWAFDESSGTTAANDGPVFLNDGSLRDFTPSNADGDTPPSFVPGKFGNAVQFDGVDDYVTLGTLPSLGSSFSVAIWIKPSSNAAQQVLSAGATRWDFRVAGSGDSILYYAFFGGSSLTGTISKPLNQWALVTLTYNSAEQKAHLYIDGVQSNEVVRAYTDGSGSFTLNPLRSFVGAADELVLYSRALSLAEIQDLMCGDGTVQLFTGNEEQCDDGNNVDGDGCSRVCMGEDSDGDSRFTYGSPVEERDCDDRPAGEDGIADTPDDGRNIYPGNTDACGDGVDNNCVDGTDENCIFCGNSVLDAGEECDGSFLGGAGCVSQNFAGGTLRCSASCSFDTSLCTNDVDGDTYIAQSKGGDDCNDANAGIHPGAVEVCGNGVDEDCDDILETVCPVCTTATAVADCNDGEICTSESCVSGRCEYSAASSTPLCRASTDAAGDPVRDPAEYCAGMSCPADVACTGSELWDATSLTCVECLADVDCTSGYECMSNACVLHVNSAPIADAGADQVIVDIDDDGEEYATITGVGADSDGTLVSSSWSRAAGLMSTAYGRSSYINRMTTGFLVGVNRLTFTVTDDTGATASDEMVIDVREPVRCTAATDCNDLQYCTVDACDMAANRCTYTIRDIDDVDACTQDACVEAVGGVSEGITHTLDCTPAACSADPRCALPPDQQDTDGDGLADVDDTCPSVANPTGDYPVDSDGDGVGDACEMTILCGNSQLDADELCDDGNILDGDGCSSLCQMELGSVGATCSNDVDCQSNACDATTLTCVSAQEALLQRLELILRGRETGVTKQDTINQFREEFRLFLQRVGVR